MTRCAPADGNSGRYDRVMDDLTRLHLDELTRRIRHRAGLVIELGELLDEVADRVDDLGKHRAADSLRQSADDMRHHAKCFEILGSRKSS